jgi:lipopolysaccharide export LptBFGC system permease protein LptF
MKKILVVKTTAFQQWEYTFLKVIVLVDKFFPFIIFISGISWVLRLKRQRAWSVFQSSGISVFQVLKGPSSVVGLMSVLELVYWGPKSHQLMEKTWAIQQKENYWIRPKTSWRLLKDAEQRPMIFHFPDKHIEVFSFNKNFVLERYVYANNFLVYTKHLILQDVWHMVRGSAPQRLPRLKVPRPLHLFNTVAHKHPLLMSFLELRSRQSNVFLSQTIQLRRNYFLSNSVWCFLLLPFSAAILAGYQRSVYRYLVNIFLGSAICFMLFIAKEWSGLFAYQFSGQILGYLMIWSVPILTLALSVVLWVENTEV